jgi:hypothetical protein
MVMLTSRSHNLKITIIIIIIIHYLLNLGWILTAKTISQIFIKNTKNMNQWDVVTEFQLPHALK